MYTLGIDVHKRTSTLVLIDDSYTVLWEQTIRSHPQDFNQIMKKVPVPVAGLPVALEPVGPWRWITELLKETGLQPHVAHPRKVALIAKSTQKTDRIDARTLAELLRSGYLPEARIVPEDIYQLRLLLRERQHVVRMRVSTINRLHGIATTQGLHAIDHGNPVTKAGMRSIMNGTNTTQKELHGLIAELDRRIKVFDEHCAIVGREIPEVKRLMTIPSVGIITALTIHAEVGVWSDFASPKHVVSYAGLCPRQRSSGTQTRHGSITRAGSPYLRTALVECAMRIHPKSAPELFAMVERLTPETGAKKARVALARKLLTLMWHMIRTERDYDSSKVIVPTTDNTNLRQPDTGTGT
jgi:transposase